MKDERDACGLPSTFYGWLWQFRIKDTLTTISDLPARRFFQRFLMAITKSSLFHESSLMAGIGVPGFLAYEVSE
jgi:hypothetical protein